MNRRIIVMALGTLLILTANSLHAQDVKIKASVDTSNIQIGDAITLILSADYNPQNFQIQFPGISDTFNHFELIEKSKIDTQAGRENNVYIQKIRITNFDSGVWMIPKFPFHVKPLQGQTPYTLFSESLRIRVSTVAVDTSKPFKPIFGIRPAAMPLEQIIMYVIGGILILALIAFLIYYFVKRQHEKNNNKVPEKVEIKLPPHEKAMQAYAALDAQHLWQQGMEKDYYTALSDIMRTYLEEQFNMECFEKTSSEIMSQVKRTRALTTSRKELRNLFETADMVKFAKGNPSAEQHIESLETAKTVILESYKKTKPLDGQA